MTHTKHTVFGRSDGHGLFADLDLAHRIEMAERTMMGDAAAGVAKRAETSNVLCEPLCGALAIWAGANSPLNKIVGLGFDGPLDLDQLASLEAAYAEREAPIHVELSTLAETTIGTELTARGYQLQGFEDVLGCRIEPRSVKVPSGLVIRESPSGEHELWIETLATGFTHPDTQGVQTQEEIPRDAMESALKDMASGPRVKRFLAILDGTVAGAASLCIHEGVAIFSGAATLPEHRCRGVQSGLLDNRIQVAADAGCDLGVVTTLPGSKSQQNVICKGFEHLYTRAILVLDPPS